MDTETARRLQGDYEAMRAWAKARKDVWIVLVEDRHGGPDVLPFSSEEAATGYARIRAGHDGITQEEMTDTMRAAGWVLYLPISEEGDRITVVKRTMDGG
jgi:hypothetical protein